MQDESAKATKMQTKVAIIFLKLGHLNETSHRVKSLSSAVRDKLLGSQPKDEAEAESGDRNEPQGILESIADLIDIDIDILFKAERTLEETNKQLNKN